MSEQAREGGRAVLDGRAGCGVGSSVASLSAQARMRSGLRQSPLCSLAMALAGNPLASGSSRPPKVMWPLAPTRSASTPTCRVAGMS